MTFATFHRSNDRALGLQISADVFHLIQRIADYRDYRKTVAALQSLSAAQLKDMGLDHGSVHAAARAAVYGAQR